MVCLPLLNLRPPLATQLLYYPLRLKLQFRTQFPPPLHLFSNSLNLHFFVKKVSGCGRSLPCSLCSSSSSYYSLPDDDFDDELNRLVVLLPEEMRRRICEHPELHELTEVVMDLGRKPFARFPSGDYVLSDCPITVEDLEHASSLVGDFAIDNRAGISRTLHRISAIRNRKGGIIGLTCRIGRAISGSANLLRDLVKDGSSLLLIGPPGVGKTTIIREIARMLANDYQKRVMIVDTSNEIGGDGDIPHAGIGNARRMQVPNSDMQHKVLIEAVENHMPQVIIIDEIGTKLEALAACTIAQRGIQLVATAHGVTIENLIMNPLLEMLVGGIQSVTLGDEEASRRGVQKTVLERQGPSTFNCGVEIISKTELRVHRCLEATVDAILRGRLPIVEVRKIKSPESKETTQSAPSTSSHRKDEIMNEDAAETIEESTNQGHREYIHELLPKGAEDSSDEDKTPLRLFVYGILKASVIQAIKQLEMDNADIQFTDNISEADGLLALLSRLKKNPGIQAAAKSHDIPIYVTKTSSLVQLAKALQALVNDLEDGREDFGPAEKIKSSEKIDALEEARIAIEQMVIRNGEGVDLLPRSSNIVSLQMDLVRKYNLQSEKIGTGLDLRVRILPLQIKRDEHREDVGKDEADTEFDDYTSIGEDENGSAYTVDRLPFLPE